MTYEMKHAPVLTADQIKQDRLLVGGRQNGKASASSPFARHADKLSGNYSTSLRLQSLVLHLYNDEDWPVRLGSLFWGADEEQTQAALEMMASYARLGENDPAFMEVARRLAEKRLSDRSEAGQ